MYSPSAEDNERSALVLDAPIANGYDEDEGDEPLDRWLVAPEHLRPWHPFEPPSALWPEARIDDLSNGACCARPPCRGLGVHEHVMLAVARVCTCSVARRRRCAVRRQERPQHTLGGARAAQV